MAIPSHLAPSLEVLRLAYPEGVPPAQRAALLVALFEDMSERNLADLLAEFLDDEKVVILDEAIHTSNKRRPSEQELKEVRHQLRSAGWEFSDDT